MFDKSRAKAGRLSATRDAEADGFSIIAGGVTIKGAISAGSDVQINGVIEGDVQCGQLMIGETGRVVGAITAEAVIVAGAVEGPIAATKVELLGTAQITGDVSYQELKIELGAKVSGKLNWAQDRGLKLVTKEAKAEK